MVWRILAAAFLAGCVQIPPSAQDLQAKRFEPVPDKAVVYIVRDSVGPLLDHTLWLGEAEMITTHTGTYYRWEVAPGTRHITGFGNSTASLALNVEAGKIYFVHHGVRGTDRSGVQTTFLERLDDHTGRAKVARASLL
jgi:Protein of unknown function (DUF2846)